MSKPTDPVPVPITLYNRATRSAVRFQSSAFVDENGVNTWIWEEGNFSCDCNRGRFWHEALVEVGGEPRYPCGGGIFAVLEIRVKSTMEVVYEEQI